MASTSSSAELASELLTYCLDGRRWPDSLVDELVRRAVSAEAGEAQDASRALFGIVVERLADLFEPKLCDAYADLFAEIIQRVRPRVRASELRSRYERVRASRSFAGSDPKRVYVLSRVTLGADVAVTSVVLDAVKRRFRDAEILFVGSRKNWALFENDPRIGVHEFAYGRGGTLRDRILSAPDLHDANAIVIDPDSRLTQLGLIPVCEEDRYFFFESRAYGGDSDRTLRDLTAEWVERTFGVAGARAYVAPNPGRDNPDITVSFGVGENAEKRVADPFEARVLAHLAGTGHKVHVDTGAGGEERERVERAAGKLGVTLWRGEYAPFASSIAQSRLYVGYDSAGQHVAAASGVPLVSVFGGYPSERMFQRWRPGGPGPVRVVKVTDRNPETVLAAAVTAIDDLLP